MHGNARDMEEEGGGSFSFDRAYSAVRRHAVFIGIVAGLIVGIATIVSIMMSNRFDASAIVQIDPRKKTISNLDSVLSELKADAATVDSEVEIIRSRAITQRVIDILGLRNDPEFSKTIPILSVLKTVAFGRDLEASGEAPIEADKANPDQIAGLLRAEKPGLAEPERDEVAVAFGEKLKVTRIRTTLLIEIRFSCTDAVKAAKIANTIAEVYIQEQLDAKQQAAGFATKLLEEKLTSLRSKVGDAERKVEQFKAQNNIFDSEGQILSEKQLARLMEQTVVARNTTAEARAKFEQVKKLRAEGTGSTAIADVLESHTVRLLKEELGKATQKEAELGTKYGPRHPDMQKVRAEVADAQRQLDAEIEKLVDNLKNEMEVAEGRERQLAANLAVLKEQQGVSKEESVKLKELERDSSTEKALYEALLARYKQTAETVELQLPDARIVEKADVPLFPASPKRKQIVFLALIGGLLTGIGIALILEFWTSGVSRSEDVERALDLEHLTSIPQISGPDDGEADPMRAVRLILAEPRGAFAEAIRGLRREIDVRRHNPQQKVILVASSLPGEGSDMIASNLAHHYALTGNRVLLIDGDLRRSPLTRRLVGSSSAGLLDVLARGAPIEQTILRDASTGLCFLPATSSDRLDVSSPEMLATRRMAALMGYLRNQFDTIVIEAPPLLPVVDGRILADYVDQIAFVMTWRKTPKKLAKRAVHALGQNQDKIAGVIVNGVAADVLEDAQGFTLSDTTPQPIVPIRRRAA